MTKLVICFLITLAVVLSVNAGGSKKGECMKKTYETMKCCNMPAFKKPEGLEECKEHLKTNDNKKQAFMCMTECNFKKMGTFSDEGELVKEKIAEVNAEFLAGDENADMLKVVNDATEVCYEKINSKMDEIKAKAVEKEMTCSPVPFFYHACIMSIVAHSCPEPRWNATAECEESKTFSAECLKESQNE